ncbi:hypothetical protein BRD15_10050 [Halobacteriales archaeon SW_6_65_15]|jgi:hypothetical protein|nr:MAG: hypothetical protein BRD15_10050 [Halobacteriales archaeon SW_6_65_15]
MLSESEALFLNRCLREVPSTASIADIEFTEDHVTDMLADVDVDESDLTRGWQRYFNARTKEVVEEGVATGDTDERYHLNPERIAEAWADEIDGKSWFAETRLEQVDEESWQFIAQSNGRGELVFRLFFNGRRVEEYTPDTLKGRFTVWFVEPKNVPDEEATFKWAEFLDDDFWETLQRDLLRLQDPRTVNICRNDSVAADDNMEGIEDAIKYKFEDCGLTVDEDPEADMPEIEEYIDGPVLFGAKEHDDAYLLVCECDLSPNHIHLHYVHDGKPAHLSESNYAEDICQFVHDKVKDYHELSAKKEDIPQTLKWLVALFGIITVPQFLPVFSFFGVNPNSQIVTNTLLFVQIGSLAIGLAIVLYLLLPVIRFRRFSWTREN